MADPDALILAQPLKPGNAELRYGVITPVHADASGLRRVASVLSRQSVLPAVWVIVADGDDQATGLAVQEVRNALPFVEVIEHASEQPERGGRVAALLEMGACALVGRVGVWFKVDADVSFAADHLETIVREFEADPTLGMASGVEINVSSGHPHYRRSKGILVAAQCRAYHADCFEAIRPLVKAPGWDTIDVAEAAVRGWRTVVVEEATFVHHREIGARDGSRRQVHLCEGVEAHRLRYRPWYLILRSLHQSMHDPAAIVQIGGYLASVAKQSDALGSPEARALLREQQRFRHLTARLKEASLDRRLRRGGLLLVANPGGHLRELVALRDVWQQWTPRVWALVDTTSAPLGESVYRLAGPTPRSVRALGLNLLRAVRVMLIERPRVLLTTGAATAVPFVWVAWLFRTEIIFLECSGRIGLSLSGKLCRPFATHYFVQWPELEDEARGMVYAGSALFGDHR